MDAALADRLQTRVKLVEGVLVLGLLPSGLADHLAEVVADVPVGALKLKPTVIARVPNLSLVRNYFGKHKVCGSRLS